MEKQNIQLNLFNYFADVEAFTISDAQNAIYNHYKQDVKEPSIRARVYEGVSRGLFRRVSKGVYCVTKKNNEGQENTCLLINGDGRDLSMINDNSIDAIITDHPYSLKKSHLGGNRNLANYECFQYTIDDFKEKYRVLKESGFLVEFLPERNAENYEYINSVMEMAKNSKLNFYSVISWKKGDFVINQGRKAKNTEEIYMWSKGKARCLRLDNKKNLALAKKHQISIEKGMTSGDVAKALTDKGIAPCYMSGTNGMLPTLFDVQPPSKSERIHQAQKPIELLEQIIDFVTLPNEVILDSFAGSGVLGASAFNKNRNSILIEKDKDIFETMKANIEQATKRKAVLLSPEEKELVDAEIKCYKNLLDDLSTEREEKSPLTNVIKTATTTAHQQNIVDGPLIDLLSVKSWEKQISDDLTLKRLYVQIKYDQQSYSIFYDFNKQEWGCRARLNQSLDYTAVMAHVLKSLNLNNTSELSMWQGSYKNTVQEINR